jgi:Zn finger protein HypA/HybF involved in hydrogenase expression
MNKKNISLKEYERLLAIKVSEEKVRCQKCGNYIDFMVNEIGHVFCKKCHTKMLMLRLGE